MTQRQRYQLVGSCLWAFILFLFWVNGGWSAVVTVCALVVVIWCIVKALQWAGRGKP